MGKIMRVYLCGQEWTESRVEMSIDLPATPWELMDALDKLNLSAEREVYTQVEEYYDFGYIQGLIPEDTSLSRLNELCAVLDSMDEHERIGFRGVLKSSLFYDQANIDFDRLMDIALARDCYHIAENVENVEQLGRFLCLNGFVAGAEDLPETICEMLDFERIGRQFRTDEHGVFTDGCYIAPEGDIPHAEVCYGIFTPEYTVMLDVANKADIAKRFPLALPASASDMEHALKQAGSETWSDAVCFCTDCRVPQLTEAITQANNIAMANRFAERLDSLSAENISKLKAVLEVTNCEDLTTASLIAQDLDSYMLSESIRNPEELGKWQLTYMLSDEDRDLILKHLNLYAYGKEVLEQDTALISSYGLIERTDKQTILTQAQQTCPQMEMQ